MTQAEKKQEHVGVFIHKSGNAYTTMGRPVSILNEDGTLVEVIESIASCAVVLGVDQGAVRHAAKKGYLLDGTYRVRFASLVEAMQIENAIRVEDMDRVKVPVGSEQKPKATGGEVQIFLHGQRLACRMAGPRGGKGKSTMYPLYVFDHGVFLCSMDADSHFGVSRGCFGHAARLGHQVYAEQGSLRARFATREEVEKFCAEQGFTVTHRKDLDKGPPKRKRSPISKSVSRRLAVQAEPKTDNVEVKEAVLAPVKAGVDMVGWATTALTILENDAVDDSQARSAAAGILKVALSGAS